MKRISTIEVLFSILFTPLSSPLVGEELEGEGNLIDRKALKMKDPDLAVVKFVYIHSICHNNNAGLVFGYPILRKVSISTKELNDP